MLQQCNGVNLRPAYRLTYIKGKGKIHLYSGAYAHTAFSSAVVTDWAIVQSTGGSRRPSRTHGL